MAKFKEFSKETWNEIKSKIDDALSEVPAPWYAAFDADGTLWSNDAGNNFFDFEIDNKLLDLPPDPWSYVYGIKAKKAEDAFLWLAQIHKSKKIDEVRSWAKKCFEAQPNYPYLESIKDLIEYLQFKGVEIIVVTASVKWAVEPGVEPLGISPDNVLGIKTKIAKDGTISDVQDGPITYQAGKKIALLERTKNVLPILAAGNTTGDLELIQLATHVKLAVTSATSESKVYKSEVALQEIAKKNSWICHSFIQKD